MALANLSPTTPDDATGRAAADIACLRCEHSRRHGWFGPRTDLSHCPECHRDWPRRNEECHCPACHRHFKSERAFDLHQVGDRCVDPAERVDRRGRAQLVARMSPHGTIWTRRDDREPPSASGSCTTATHRDEIGSTMPRPASRRPSAGAGSSPTLTQRARSSRLTAPARSDDPGLSGLASPEADPAFTPTADDQEATP